MTIDTLLNNFRLKRRRRRRSKISPMEKAKQLHPKRKRFENYKEAFKLVVNANIILLQVMSKITHAFLKK